MNTAHTETVHHPPWKEGIRRFQLAKWTYGDVISEKWLYKAMNLPHPDDLAFAPGATPQQIYKEMQAAELKFVGQFYDGFQRVLLEECRMLVIRRRNAFYVVPPDEQVANAEIDAHAAIQKALKQAMQRASLVHRDGLSVEGQRSQREAVHHLAQLSLTVRPRRVVTNYFDQQRETTDGLQ